MMIRSKWYAIDIAPDYAEISVFDEIGGFGVSVTDFKEQFDSIKNAKQIRLLLNSPGGAVTEGMAFYNLLASVRDKLTVEVIGLAASMASVVALAGSKLVMDEGTYLMIHNPWTITWGDADQLRKDADVLDKMRSELISIYAAHSKLSPKEIGQMMDDETWLTAQEAFDSGFADEVRETVQAAALYDVSKIGFKKIPMALKHLDFRSIKTIRDFEAFLRDAGATRAEAAAIASGGWKALQRDAEQPKSEDDGEIKEALSGLISILKGESNGL
jgi:ATP-dependent Clp endopeptidase proteolytic subunit ClpP